MFIVCLVKLFIKFLAKALGRIHRSKNYETQWDDGSFGSYNRAKSSENKIDAHAPVNGKSGYSSSRLEQKRPMHAGKL